MISVATGQYSKHQEQTHNLQWTPLVHTDTIDDTHKHHNTQLLTSLALLPCIGLRSPDVVIKSL